jgi:hypothetical protein
LPIVCAIWMSGTTVSRSQSRSNSLLRQMPDYAASPRGLVAVAVSAPPHQTGRPIEHRPYKQFENEKRISYPNVALFVSISGSQQVLMTFRLRLPDLSRLGVSSTLWKERR